MAPEDKFCKGRNAIQKKCGCEDVSVEMNFLERIWPTMEAFEELAFDLDQDTSSIVKRRKAKRKNNASGCSFLGKNGLVPN